MEERHNEKEIFGLCDRIRETAFALHRYLRHGHNEKIYERGLLNRLRKAGIGVEQQFPLSVYDEDGTCLGDFAADLFMEGKIIIELKAWSAVTSDHTSQLLGYMRAARTEHGLLINFGAPKLYIKKFILSNPDEHYEEN